MAHIGLDDHLDFDFFDDYEDTIEDNFYEIASDVVQHTDLNDMELDGDELVASYAGGVEYRIEDFISNMIRYEKSVIWDNGFTYRVLFDELSSTDREDALYEIEHTEDNTALIKKYTKKAVVELASVILIHLFASYDDIYLGKNQYFCVTDDITTLEELKSILAIFDKWINNSFGNTIHLYDKEVKNTREVIDCLVTENKLNLDDIKITVEKIFRYLLKNQLLSQKELQDFVLDIILDDLEE